MAIFRPKTSRLERKNSSFKWLLMGLVLKTFIDLASTICFDLWNTFKPGNDSLERYRERDADVQPASLGFQSRSEGNTIDKNKQSSQERPQSDVEEIANKKMMEAVASSSPPQPTELTILNSWIIYQTKKQLLKYDGEQIAEVYIADLVLEKNEESASSAAPGSDGFGLRVRMLPGYGVGKFTIGSTEVELEVCTGNIWTEQGVPDIFKNPVKINLVDHQKDRHVYMIRAEREPTRFEFKGKVFASISKTYDGMSVSILKQGDRQKTAILWVHNLETAIKVTSRETATEGPTHTFKLDTESNSIIRFTLLALVEDQDIVFNALPPEVLQQHVKNIYH